MAEDGGVGVAARVALLGGAAGSLALMMRAGARQRSLLLIALFTAWVLSPFLALALANVRARSWPARIRRALYAAAIGVAALCLCVYGFNAARGGMKAGFVYLVVPAAAWLVIGITVAAAAVVRRQPVK